MIFKNRNRKIQEHTKKLLDHLNNYKIEAESNNLVFNETLQGHHRNISEFVNYTSPSQEIEKNKKEK